MKIHFAASCDCLLTWLWLDKTKHNCWSFFFFFKRDLHGSKGVSASAVLSTPRKIQANTRAEAPHRPDMLRREVTAEKQGSNQRVWGVKVKGGPPSWLTSRTPDAVVRKQVTSPVTTEDVQHMCPIIVHFTTTPFQHFVYKSFTMLAINNSTLWVARLWEISLAVYPPSPWHCIDTYTTKGTNALKWTY